MAVPIRDAGDRNLGHLSGRLAALLTAKARDLFAQPPNIKEVDVLAAKLAQ